MCNAKATYFTADGVRRQGCTKLSSKSHDVVIQFVTILHVDGIFTICLCTYAIIMLKNHHIIHWNGMFTILIIPALGLQLHSVDDNVGKSRRILNSMTRRMSRNKWIMGSIIGVLILAIVLVIYVKVARWKSRCSVMIRLSFFCVTIVIKHSVVNRVVLPVAPLHVYRFRWDGTF